MFGNAVQSNTPQLQHIVLQFGAWCVGLQPSSRIEVAGSAHLQVERSRM